MSSIDNIYSVDVRYGGTSKQVVRGSMLNGGGVCNTAMIQCVNGNAIKVNIYQSHTSSVDITTNISVTRLH